MNLAADILAHRSWLQRSLPFPHLVAWNVFRDDFYAALAAQVRGILARGLSETPDPERFSRSIPGYDAHSIALQPPQEGPLGLFLSPEWRDLVCGLFGITPTPYMFAGAHHHEVGSANGFVHNDLNPVWFPAAGSRVIQTPDYRVCAYKTGAGPLRKPAKIQVVRAAVVIFYLLDDDWRSGDGGETGLYSSASRSVTQPDARVPPERNSLLAFECMPNSYHSFLSNRRTPRTSIIMWVHRMFEDAAAKFGVDRLEHWK